MPAVCLRPYWLGLHISRALDHLELMLGHSLHSAGVVPDGGLQGKGGQELLNISFLQVRLLLSIVSSIPEGLFYIPTLWARMWCWVLRYLLQMEFVYILTLRAKSTMFFTVCLQFICLYICMFCLLCYSPLTVRCFYQLPPYLFMYACFLPNIY